MKKSHAVLLLLLLAVGCDDSTQSEQAAEMSAKAAKVQEENSKAVNANIEATTTDGALSDEQVAVLLSQKIGQWEGTSVIKGPDGEVQSEFPMIDTTTWLEKGKSIEMQVTEKLPQGDQQLVFTKWYDKEQQRFLLTRRMGNEEVPAKPGAYETYDADSNTLHGVVVEGLPPGMSWTWTSEWISQDSKWIYTGHLRQDDKIQSTRIDTIQRIE